MSHFNPYQKDSKIYMLFEQIKKIRDLKHITSQSKEIPNVCKTYYNSIVYNHLHACVIKTKKYPFLNEYIDEYLNLYPERIDYIGRGGYTALLISIISFNRSSFETIKILLKHDANVNMRFGKGYVLFLFAVYQAIYCQKVKIIKILVEYNADIELENSIGENAVTIAFKEFEPEDKNIINILLPNRMEFIKSVTKNKKRILKNESWYWNVNSCDFKIIFKMVENFYNIIEYM